MRNRSVFYALAIFFTVEGAQAKDWMVDASMAPGAFSDTVEEANTYRLLEAQTRDRESRIGNFQTANYIQQGNDRARAVVTLIQQKEIRARVVALKPIEERLKNNAYIATPAKVVGAGVALWIGKSVSLVKNDSVVLETRIEGRARMGSVNLRSPAVNASLEAKAGGGVNVAMNRMVPVIDSVAEVYYGMADRNYRAYLSRPIVDQVVLSVGAGSVDSTRESVARLSYSVVL